MACVWLLIGGGVDAFFAAQIKQSEIDVLGKAFALTLEKWLVKYFYDLLGRLGNISSCAIPRLDIPL